MEPYIRFIVRHRRAVLLVVAVVTALLATQLRYLHLEIRRRANLPEDHPYVQIQTKIWNHFGGEGVVVLGVVAASGTIYTPTLLGKIYRITDRVAEIPGVVKSSVFSLASPNVKAISTGIDGTMDVHPLLTDSNATAEDAAQVRDIIRGDVLFRDTLVSRDETAAVIVVEFDESLTDSEIAQRIEAATAPERDDTVRIAAAGAPILSAALKHYTLFIAVLFPVAVLVIGLVHYEAFRTLQAMFLPLMTALLSVVWALGIIGALRRPMDSWSAVTPVVILAVAAGHAVQILKRYYEEFGRTGNNAEAVVRSIIAVGPVTLVAGSIAAAGFASLLMFGISSVRVFGLLLASGILSALVIEMTFTPACRSFLPAPRPREIRREGEAYWLDRGLERIAAVVLDRPWYIIGVAITLTALAGIGTARIEVDNSLRLWFSPSTRVRRDDALLNDKLAGTASLRILIEGEREGALQRPAVLRAISDLEDFMKSDPHVGGVVSLADYVKRIHQAMNGSDPDFYRIPDDERLIAQYLLLYGMSAGPDTLSSMVDAGYQRGLVRALSNTDSAAFSRDFLRRLQSYAATRFQGLAVHVGIAGGTIGIQTAMNDTVVREKLMNALQITVIIFLLSAAVFRSAIAGLLVLVPLVVAFVAALGSMGWSHTPLDMSTAAFTAMGLSIGADFAIYLLFRIREEMAEQDSLDAAVSTALRTSGKAIFFVSSAVALGYMVLPLSGFSLWMRLGAITALIITVSAVTAVTIVPALTLAAQPRFLKSRHPLSSRDIENATPA